MKKYIFLALFLLIAGKAHAQILYVSYENDGEIDVNSTLHVPIVGNFDAPSTLYLNEESEVVVWVKNATGACDAPTLTYSMVVSSTTDVGDTHVWKTEEVAVPNDGDYHRLASVYRVVGN